MISTFWYWHMCIIFSPCMDLLPHFYQIEYVSDGMLSVGCGLHIAPSLVFSRALSPPLSCWEIKCNIALWRDPCTMARNWDHRSTNHKELNDHNHVCELSSVSFSRVKSWTDCSSSQQFDCNLMRDFAPETISQAPPRFLTTETTTW